MFKGMGQLAGLLKNAGQIKQNMEQMNERLKAARFAGEAGGEQVRATVDGKGELISLKIDPNTVAADDVELLEDLVVAAVRNAVSRSREGAQKEMEQATGGLDMSGMMDMLGGGAPGGAAP